MGAKLHFIVLSVHGSACVLHNTTAVDMVRVCDQLSGEKTTRFRSLFFLEKGIARTHG